MGELIFDLSQKILKTEKKYDRVVALAKGGWTWSRTLVDLLKTDELDSIRLRLYHGIGERKEKAEIIRPLSFDITGENILIFDDVVDSGITLEQTRKYLLQKGAKAVESAALFIKPSSKIRPDFFGFETSSWIIFPHELREFVEQSYDLWTKDGISFEDINKRYSDLGLPRNQVNFFLSKLKKGS